MKSSYYANKIFEDEYSKTYEIFEKLGNNEKILIGIFNFHLNKHISKDVSSEFVRNYIVELDEKRNQELEEVLSNFNDIVKSFDQIT